MTRAEQSKLRMRTKRYQHPAYNVWCMMRGRCNNPRNAEYPNYGGRGISVCSRWDSFEMFEADMGPRPPGYTIERKDTNGNYEPDNCVWANWKTQGRNKRNTRLSAVAALCMRELRRRGATYSVLGRAFGVSKRMAINVCAGKSWA